MSTKNRTQVIVSIGFVCGFFVVTFLYFYSGRNWNNSQTKICPTPPPFSIPKLEKEQAQTQKPSASIFEMEFTSPYDPRILNYIRQKKLNPPSPKPYNINTTVPLQDLNNLVSFLKKKRNGFFIECGANDGQFLSESLKLEKEFGWTGLLIEASTTYYRKLLLARRKAWSANICLSGKVEKLEFMTKDDAINWEVGIGKINSRGKYKPVGGAMFDQLSIEGSVDCFPLASVLAALDVKTVNYFILDVEGHEYKVLSAIPFSKLNIEVLKVEYDLAPEGKNAIKKLMQKNNYYLLGEKFSDLYFVKKGVRIK